MPGARIDGVALGSLAAGSVLVYAGIKGYSIPVVLQSVIQGKTPSTGQSNPPKYAITDTSQQQQSNGGSQQQQQQPSGGQNLGGGGSPTANKAIGMLLAAQYGWGPGTQNWAYLESGWEEESGWSTTAAFDQADPYNHAYGIPQSNPGTKMASAGSDWKTSASTQIRWGLQYIKDTYGSPMQVPNWSPNGPLPGYQGY